MSSEMTESTETGENADVVEIVIKQSIRRKVWAHLEKNNLVNFPRPATNRIPNFKGCEEATERLVELPEFKAAQNIKVNPDKPQIPVRFAVLEHYKNLFVPIPSLSSGLLKHIIRPENATKEELRKIISQRGIYEGGKDINLNDKVKINMIVIGSVAVSKQGYRIGKGRGYADLEFGILSQIGAVDQNTIIVTTVHDDQVFDTLPEDLFQAHDVPIDIIVTPTQVIRVEKRLPRPLGVIWNILSELQVNLMPVLQSLREIDEKEGKDVTLRPSSPNDRVYNPRHKRRPLSYRRRRSELKNSESSDKERTENNNIRPIHKRRSGRPRGGKSNGENAEKENDPVVKRRQRKNIRKNHGLIDFSLMVRNIESNVRVRDLKAALAERGVKPKVITWRGVKGYCCLHFTKAGLGSVPVVGNGEREEADVDSVLGMLQNLKVSAESQTELEVKIMKPASRIETTDVSSV